jgi:Flp pilus assembly protein TadD
MRYLAAALLLSLASCSTSPQSGAVLFQAPAPVLATWTPSLGLADTALSAGAPTVALQIANELLAKDPRDVNAQVRRGNALTALGRNGEAEASFARALEIKPEDRQALIGLGRLRLLQDPVAAEALFAHILVLDPQDVIALSDLGVARDLQGHHAAAQQAYRSALGITPASVPVQVNLGLSMALSGDADAAVRVLQPLAAIPDAAPRVRQDLAVALALSGRRNEASVILARDLPSDQVRATLDGLEALRP